jgi:hypothetical protein
MNLRWLVGNYADPEFNLTRAQQHQVTWLAHKKHLSSWKLLAWTLAMTLAGWLFLGVTWDAIAAMLVRLRVPQPRFMSIALICITVSIVAAWLYRYLYTRPVRLAMRDLGHDVCIGCGYRLQGLGADITRCPECGHARQPMPDAGAPDRKDAQP